MNDSMSVTTTGSRPPTGRIVWLALIVVSGVGLTLFFACATPFAALATLAALKTKGRDAAAVTGLVWLGNQAVGYGYLGYPWTWDSVAWGLAIGLSVALALLTALALSPRRSASLAVSLPFVGAFAAYELSLYIASFALPSSDTAFAAAVVEQLFLVNLVALLGLIAAHQVASLIGLLLRNNTASGVAGAAASLR